MPNGPQFSEEAMAQLVADRERLDWMHDTCPKMRYENRVYAVMTERGFWVERPSLREAIDAAMVDPR